MDSLEEKKIIAKPYTVTELNRAAKTVLEGQLGRVAVEGEVSNLTRAPSGHAYFSLKDAGAQIRAAYFRRGSQPASALLQHGAQLLVHGRVSLYEPRGDYQLIVESIELAGLGALQRAFEALKAKLLAEGLFDPKNKKPIPTCPAVIGVVTSPNAAALQDILHAIERRFKAAHVIIYPTRVQGAEAADEIVQAIANANRDGRADVLLVARGGGSLEDLWPFNEERVARAIFASRIPTISGVGHETDVTIADFVADLRAPTPTAAAELATPEMRIFQQKRAVLTQNLCSIMQRVVERKSHQWLMLQKSLVHPKARLAALGQQWEKALQSLCYVIDKTYLQCAKRLDVRMAALLKRSPHTQLEVQTRAYHALHTRLNTVAQRRYAQWEHRLQCLNATLNALSPYAILGRGYSITYDAQGRVITHVAAVKSGDALQTVVQDGRFDVTVK